VERLAYKAKLARLTDTELLLDDEQFNKLGEIMSHIEKANADELQKVFKEADSFSVGDSVHVTWESDKNNAIEKFSNDQKGNSELIKSL